MRFIHKGRKRLSSITLQICEIWLFPKNQSNITKRLRFQKLKCPSKAATFRRFLELGANIQQKSEK